MQSNSEDRKISKAVIRRLPRYYRYLSDLFDNGVEKISSKQLSVLMNATASQIRQDLNTFGEFGLQGYGYNVRYLKNEISRVMGIDQVNNMILVGAGNLGKALLKYNGFNKKRFLFKAVFDKAPSRVENFSDDYEVYPISELNDYLDNNEVDIVVLTVPKSSAQEVVDLILSKRGIGIWNFASTDLEADDNTIVENVHLSESLMRLSYNLKEGRQDW